MIKCKNENLAQILGGQNWAVTNLPHLQESRPEIPRVERERERGRNMTTLVFNYLLGATLIFLFEEHRLTSMNMSM